MDCSMINTLWGTQVGARPLLECFAIPVGLDVQEVWALVDMGFRKALVK